MNTLKTATHAFIAVACALFIHSKSIAEPVNLSQLKTEIRAYHDSGAYRKEISAILVPATRYIIQRADDNEKNQIHQKLAIVLDIDETSLSNYHSMHVRDFSEDEQKIQEHMHAANAPAIKPMLSLYNNALKHHVAVFFVTGRTSALKAATIRNLNAAGYRGWTGLYFKPNTYHQPSIAVFKAAARHEITQKGYTIIESIGDQQSDLTGGYAEKTFKLPNPHYYIA